MGKYIGSCIAAIFCWASVVIGATAQEPPPRPDRRDVQQPPGAPTQPGQPSTNAGSREAQTHRVKGVLGSRVSIQGGLSVGAVDDIIFDDDGYIDYLVVLNEGKYVVVPWQAAKFNFAERAATVDISQQQFQQVPTFSIQAWPVFDAAYRQHIYRYYNLPGRERRIDRREDRRGP
jgi:hypothetical protein